MAGAAPRTEVRPLSRRARLARAVLVGTSIAFLGLLLVAPLGVVLAQSFAKGWEAYLGSFADDDTRAAIRLTLLTAAIVVPVNTVFGICAAWAPGSRASPTATPARPSASPCSPRRSWCR